MFALFQKTKKTLEDKTDEDSLYTLGEISTFDSKYIFWICLIPMKWIY